MTRNKGGRPKQEVLKTTNYLIRLTEEQKKTLFYNAKQQHYKTTASYVLYKLFSRNLTKNVSSLSISDAQKISISYQEIKKCGVNINQITRKINSFFPDTDESILIYELKKVQENQKIMLEKIEDIYKIVIENTKNMYSSENENSEEII